jgi:hypothetical protein
MSEAGSEMQGLPQAPKGPLVKLLEGFHSPCTACIRLVEWRDRKSIVTLTRTTNPSISLALRAPACQRAGSEMQLPQAPKGPLVKLLVEGFHSLHGMHSFGRVARS